MYILGISFDYHDAAAAILKDGVCLAAAEEERFSRLKHDAAYPRRAVEFCLAQAGIKVGEYAPNAVKKAVVGVGHADKRQVDHMVRMQLPGVEIAGPDAADALAIAICHAHMSQTRARVAV